MARRNQLPLIVNGAASSAQMDWPGGAGACYCEGTFAGSTIKLQTLSPNGTLMDVGAEVTFTTNGVGGFSLPAGKIQMTVTGGPPSAVYAYAVGIPTNNGG